MKLLILDWGTYTQPDINECLHEHNVQYRVFFYCFNNKNEDELFLRRFGQCLKEDNYDAVFSVNYFPLAAQACYEHNVKYLSWSYDNPLNVHNIEATLGLPVNYVFLFDKVQMRGYAEKGFQNVFHLPLGVNEKRLNAIRLTKDEQKRFSSEISFVGKLYESQLPLFMSAMDDYCKGYIDSLLKAQLKLYGAYLIDEALTEDFMNRINEHYRKVEPDTKFVLPKEALSYACAAQVTRNERLLLLGLLSSHFQVKLYSKEQNPLLDKVQYMGSCDYIKEMPKVFKTSRINLNITLKILQAGIPLRALDILGVGGFLLSNYQEELAENFENEKEIVLYDSVEDAYAKANFYLQHEELRRQIAANGHAKVIENFSYDKQLSILFKTAGLEL